MPPIPSNAATPGSRISIEDLRTDPEYLALPPEERARLIKQAIRFNADVYRSERAKTPLSGVDEFGRFDLLGGQLASGQGDLPAPKVYRGMLPVAGGIVGNIAGAYLGGGVGRPIGGAAGTTAGQALEDYNLEEQSPTLSGLGRQFAGNLVSDLAFQGAESLGRGALRGIARNIPAGAKIRFDAAAQRARQLAARTFQPLPLDEISPMFEQVRNSGVRVADDTTASFLTQLQQGRYDDLLHEVRQIDRSAKNGGLYEDLLGRLRGAGAEEGVSRIGLDIGEAQTLSSGIRKRLEATNAEYQGRQLLKDFRESLDSDIFSGAAVGPEAVSPGATQQLLQNARREYARFRGAEELSGLVEDNIRSTPDLKQQSFALNNLVDALRKDRTKVAQDVNRALDYTPNARGIFDKEIDELAKNFQTIEVVMADVTGIRRNPVVAGLGQLFGLVLLSDAGRKVFTNAVVNGRGTVSINALALAASVARNDLLRGIQAPGQNPNIRPDTQENTSAP